MYGVVLNAILQYSTWYNILFPPFTSTLRLVSRPHHPDVTSCAVTLDLTTAKHQTTRISQLWTTMAQSL